MAIMAKLEVNAEKPKDESEVNFAFAEDGKGSNSGTGYVKIKPASPSDFNGDPEKGQTFLNTAAFTSVSVETCSQETKHASTRLSCFLCIDF